MLGSPTKIHRKYDVTEDDLDKIRAIAISHGMKLPSFSYSNQRPSSTSGPHSSPRDQSDDFMLSRGGSARTIIPTAETTSVEDENPDIEESKILQNKNDRSTSDHEDNEYSSENPELNPNFENSEATSSNEADHSADLDKVSVKSDTILLKPGSGKQRSVTFLTENNDE